MQAEVREIKRASKLLAASIPCKSKISKKTNNIKEIENHTVSGEDSSPRNVNTEKLDIGLFLLIHRM